MSSQQWLSDRAGCGIVSTPKLVNAVLRSYCRIDWAQCWPVFMPRLKDAVPGTMLPSRWRNAEINAAEAEFLCRC